MCAACMTRLGCSPCSPRSPGSAVHTVCRRPCPSYSSFAVCRPPALHYTQHARWALGCPFTRPPSLACCPCVQVEAGALPELPLQWVGRARPRKFGRVLDGEVAACRQVGAGGGRGGWGGICPVDKAPCRAGCQALGSGRVLRPTPTPLANPPFPPLAESLPPARRLFQLVCPSAWQPSRRPLAGRTAVRHPPRPHLQPRSLGGRMQLGRGRIGGCRGRLWHLQQQQQQRGDDRDAALRRGAWPAGPGAALSARVLKALGRGCRRR